MRTLLVSEARVHCNPFWIPLNPALLLRNMFCTLVTRPTLSIPGCASGFVQTIWRFQSAAHHIGLLKRETVRRQEFQTNTPPGPCGVSGTQFDRTSKYCQVSILSIVYDTKRLIMPLFYFSWCLIYMGSYSNIIFLEKNNNKWIEKRSDLPHKWFLIVSKKQCLSEDKNNLDILDTENKTLFCCRQKEHYLRIKSMYNKWYCVS